MNFIQLVRKYSWTVEFRGRRQ